MNYEGILQFKGTWRGYQERVLRNSEKYMQDGRVHIVAAPGSGKTTLGIELIKRMSEPALVLAPSITIREQWVARITDAFLCEGVKPEGYLSQSLKEPRAITVVTYQALHSALTHFKGTLDEEVSSKEEISFKGESGSKEEISFKEEVDFEGFDLIGMIKENRIGVLCLDECHHLRSEWWKALEEVKAECKNLKVIALTATPPYDSTPAMWKRYMDMCGEIDEEITIPELVKEGSLCPHQDFVYFNYPTKEETSEVERFKERSKNRFDALVQNTEFFEAIKTHKCLNGEINEDKLLEKPENFSALLIFLQAKQYMFPSRLQKLLGAKRLPPMDAGWMEKLLQAFCYDDAESYGCSKEYREELIDLLKSDGLIEKKKVSFTTNEGIEKLLTNSKGKANSIKEIVNHEYQALGKELRLLVLTDYIRKEYEKVLGVNEAEINALGVLPFFEMLRREKKEYRLGVLCGTIVIIPAEAKQALEKEVEGIGKISFSQIGNIPETDYIKVSAVGDAHFLTGAVTNVFSKGYMQVLVGTKSLLGEGWDSPCINSLILASFVGSFMLSNQMRGRAIRVFKEQPEKTSNIWHLVCLNPWNAKVNAYMQREELCEDFALLSRRMDHFLGLHYTEDVIENGMDRLSVICAPYTKENVAVMNRKTLEISGQRATLKERWLSALARTGKMEIVEETEVADVRISPMVFTDSLRETIFLLILMIPCIALWLCTDVVSALWIVVIFGLAIKVLTRFPKLILLGSPIKRLKACGNSIRRALLKANSLETDASRVVVEQCGPASLNIYLANASNRDKEVFTKCVKEFFAPLDNQRYLLVKAKGNKGADGFYCVPDQFAKNKEDAERFAELVRPYLGKYDLVYTRNEAGRQLLLEGRIKAMANREERLATRKKVKKELV